MFAVTNLKNDDTTVNISILLKIGTVLLPLNLLKVIILKVRMKLSLINRWKIIILKWAIRYS